MIRFSMNSFKKLRILPFENNLDIKIFKRQFYRKAATFLFKLFNKKVNIKEFYTVRLKI